MGKEWTWSRARRLHDGVTLYADRLAWWSANWETPFAEGGGCDQTFEEFLADGPVLREIPPEMLEELYAAVKLLISERNAHDR